MGDTSPAKRGKDNARAVRIKRNGDSLYPGRRFVVNRRVRTLDAFLTDVTTGIRAPFGAVRQLCTPAGGTRIDSLEQLQPDKVYVACGMERFKPKKYGEDPDNKQANRSFNRSFGKPVTLAPLPPVKRQERVPGRLRQLNRPKIVTVFRNGDIHYNGARLLLDWHTLTDFEKVLSIITDKVSLRTGAVRRLCDMDGQDIYGLEEIENGASYVAVGHGDRFLKLPYIAKKASDSPRKSKPTRLKPLKKAPRPRPVAPEDDQGDGFPSLFIQGLPNHERRRKDRPQAANLGVRKRSVGAPHHHHMESKSKVHLTDTGDVSMEVPPQHALTPDLSARRKQPAAAVNASSLGISSTPRTDSRTRHKLPFPVPGAQPPSPVPATVQQKSVFYADPRQTEKPYSPSLAAAEKYYTETAGTGVFNAANQLEADDGEVVEDHPDLVVDKPILLHDDGQDEEVIEEIIHHDSYQGSTPDPTTPRGLASAARNYKGRRSKHTDRQHNQPGQQPYSDTSPDAGPSRKPAPIAATRQPRHIKPSKVKDTTSASNVNASVAPAGQAGRFLGLPVKDDLLIASQSSPAIINLPDDSHLNALGAKQITRSGTNLAPSPRKSPSKLSSRSMRSLNDSGVDSGTGKALLSPRSGRNTSRSTAGSKPSSRAGSKAHSTSRATSRAKSKTPVRPQAGSSPLPDSARAESTATAPSRAKATASVTAPSRAEGTASVTAFSRAEVTAFEPATDVAAQPASNSSTAELTDTILAEQTDPDSPPQPAGANIAESVTPTRAESVTESPGRAMLSTEAAKPAASRAELAASRAELAASRAELAA
eukprot:scpid43788/ scgid3901/ Doublecortin domain-containing protein 2; Protein RU2S